MQISCDCGKFRADLKAFPKNTPGRIKCYCDDCQTYLHHLGRGDLLDQAGGTEIIPVFPSDVEIISGRENLKCTRLSGKGMFRFSTSCCNTPIANTAPGTPWLGVILSAYSDKNELDRALGPVQIGILGKFAKGTPPKGTAQTFSFKAMLKVGPYVLRGKILGKSAPSPFFSQNDQPIAAPHVLSKDEIRAARNSVGI